MTASELLKAQGFKNVAQKHEPVWTGPNGTGPNGGITFSLLSRFLVCRERFRVHVMDGLQPSPTFNHKMEYGNLWHVCEENLAAGTDWRAALRLAGMNLKKKYPFSQSEVSKWTCICEMQFPEYVAFWKKKKEKVQKKALLSEQTFSVPYTLPSGRVVTLRGKWDSVYQEMDEEGKGTWLMENKTKGDVNELKIRKQLKYDCQTMIYLVALQTFHDGLSLRGVRYNVVQRPLSGEKGTIRQKQNEEEGDYYERLRQYFVEEPERYFMRWKIRVSEQDVANFKMKTLNPILENLWDWWIQVSGTKWTAPVGYSTSMNWVTPFGIWNPLLDGGQTDLDDYILQGSRVGLVRVDNLFPELQ